MMNKTAVVLRAVASGLTMVALVAVGVGPAAAGPPSSAAALPADFAVYERTTYPNIDLAGAGAIRGHIVTNASWGPLLAEGGLPPESDFKSLVISRASGPGPVVLDFETIYIRGSIDATTAERRRKQWIQLLDWADAAVPNQIGIYNFVHEINPIYLSYGEEVLAHADLIFPSMYTYITNANTCGDQSGWSTRLNAVLTRADDIAPGKPVIPFIWPQSYPTCPMGSQFVPGPEWRWELDTLLAQGADGAFIYSGSTAPVAETDWFDETVDFINSL